MANIQKGRADLLLSWLKGGSRPRSRIIEPHIKRPDILELIQQQERGAWLDLSDLSEWVLMDSYSELVDRKFTHRAEGWSFAACYGDIRHSTDFKSQFEFEDFLPLNKIEETYKELFQTLFARFPSVKILFFHFPVAFESRELYRERHAVIENSIHSLAQLWPDRLFSFSVPDSEVERPGLYRGIMEGHNPYHFGPGTSAFLAKGAKAVIDHGR
ncbi:MAG: hypothetical protein KDK37_12120 [Leptospiraceae bacterium]|nr:hypothetical protein [Leptospiraceae bacterium]